MGEAYRGLTIQFKADGTKVLSTLRSMTRAASQVESELRMVQKGLKYNPASMKLAQSQMNLLREKASALGAEVIGLQRHMKELGKVKFDGVEMRELSARTKDATTAASLLKARYANVTEALAETRNRVHAVWQESRALSTMANPFDNKRTKTTTTELQRLVTLMRRFGVISDESASKATSSLMQLRAEYRKLAAAWSSSEKLAKEKNPFVNAESLSTKQIDQFIARMKKAGAITESEADRMRASVTQLRGAMAQISDKYTWSNFSTGQLQKLIGVMERFGAITEEEAAKAKAAVTGLRAEFSKAASQYEKFSHIAEYQSMGNKMELEAAKMKAAIREMNEAARTLRPTGFEDSLARVSTFYRSMTGQVSRLKQAMKLDPGNYDLIAAHANAARGKVEALKIENRELRAEMDKLGETSGVKELAADLKRLVAGIHASDQTLEEANTNFVEMGARVNDAKARLQELVVELHKLGMSGKEIKQDETFRAYREELTRAKEKLLEADAAQRKAAQSAQMYAQAMKYAENANRMAANEAEIASTQGTGFRKIKLNAEEVKADAETIKAAIKEANAAMRTLRPTGYEDALERASAKVREMDAQVKELKQAMRLDPKSFALVEAHAEAAKGKVEALKVENEQLRAEMTALGKTAGVKELASDYSRLVREMSKNDAAVNRVNTRFAEAEAKISQARAELRRTAVELHNLGKKGKEIRLDAGFQEGVAKLHEYQAELREAGVEQDRLTRKAKTYADAVKLGANANKIAANEAMIAAQQQQKAHKMTLLSSSAATALGMTMYSTLYPAVMMAGTYAIQAAEDVDAAYRNMRKTVQGTDEEFEQLKKSALEFGDTHFTSADQLLQIEAIGGQLGITVDNLEAFSKTISNLNIATNIDDPEELATQFGKMASVMGLTSKEYDKFADSLVRLGNSEPAMESDILNMATRFMGMGKVVGMSSDEMLAWATTAVATGQKAEAAGSSMLRMTGRFEAAVAGVSDEMTNLEDLTEEDIEELQAAQDKLQGYADVADMTAEQFAALWKSDPSKALKAFVEGLHDMDKNGESAVQALKDLGINNVRDQQLFLGLANTTDVLNDSLTMSRNAWNGVSDEWGNAGDAAREAEKKAQGFSGALQIMKNNGQHLASMMGESLAPTLHAITGVIQSAVSAFATLEPGMQQAITLAIGLSAGMGPALTAFGAMSNAVRSAKNSWKEYTSSGNKVARMESSRVMTMTGMADKYKKWIKEVDKAKASVERCNKAANKPSVMTNPRAMAQVNEGWRKANTTLTKTQLKVSALSKVQAVGGLLGSVGSMAAIGALLVGLEKVGAYLYDVHQKSEAYKKSTEGLASVADRVRSMSESAGESISEQAKAMDAAGYQQGRYFGKVEEIIKANAELADTIEGKLNSALSNSAMAEFYSEKIKELAGSCNGSSEKLAELQAYIDKYNQLTGSNVQITDDFTGAINASTKALEAQKEAFIQNAIAEAYSESLKETASALADVQMQRYELQKSLQSTYDEAALLGVTPEMLREYAVKFGELQDLITKDPTAGQSAMDQWVSALEAAYPGITAQIQKQAELLQSDATLAEQEAQLIDDADALADAYGKQAAAASEAEKKADKLGKKAGSIKSFNNALAEVGDNRSFEQMAQELGYTDDEVEQFGKDLASLGADAKQLAQIGTDSFMEIYNKAMESGGGIEEVAKAVKLVNATSIEPKDIEIEDGQIEVTISALRDLDKEELRKKGYEVSDDGTISVETEKVDGLKEDLTKLGNMTVTPTVKAATDEAKRAINDVINLLAKVTSKTITLTTRKETQVVGARPGHASGGISRLPLNIPRHAAGGLNGIATRATLTNIGWVGEAGAEAIVPLSNRRYVRPFARAVAAEIGGTTSDNGVAQAPVTYISINGINVDSESRIGGLVAELADYVVQSERM